jgi:hypothetical protein
VSALRPLSVSATGPLSPVTPPLLVPPLLVPPLAPPLLVVPPPIDQS